MMIGERIREFREAKRLSQKDMENRTGLLRSYLSRVENGHTVPSLGTVEKYARALGVPLYQLFYDSDKPPAPEDLSGQRSAKEIIWGISGKDGRYFIQFRRHLSRMKEGDRRLLLSVAERIWMNRRRASMRRGETQTETKAD